VIHFLDTSALKWAYIPGRKHTRRCRTIIGRSNGNVCIAEISVLELVSALGHEVRGHRMSIPGYSRANLRFLDDVARGSIEVCTLPSSEYVSCRHLLQLVGIKAGRELTSQDGIVAYTAARVARQRRAPVKVLTSDRKLAKVIREVDVLSRLLTSEYLDPNPRSSP
jgi:hypothetical protein